MKAVAPDILDAIEDSILTRASERAARGECLFGDAADQVDAWLALRRDHERRCDRAAWWRGFWDGLGRPWRLFTRRA